MSAKQPTLKALKKMNADLKTHITNQKMQNSLADLVQSAQAQANITSFNPILANNIYAPLTMNWTLLTYMYKTHGVLQTAIEVPVLDGLRGGLDISSKELDSDEIKELQDFLEEEGVLDVIGEAMVWARLYGGGALIINTNQDPETPLTLKNIKKLEFYAANRWELTSDSGWKPGMPTIVSFAPKDSDFFYFYGKKIHKSRILPISGKAAPYIIRWQLQGWGMSEVERQVEDFNKYLKTENVLYELLEEAKIDVYRLKHFNTLLASAQGTALTEARIQMMNQLKNYNRAIVMDTEDEFDQKQLTYAGLAELKVQNRIGLACAARMPLTKLFGVSAAGFSSGEDDIENYNATVESEIRQKLRRPVKNVLRLVCCLLFGQEFDLRYTFKPLRVLGAVEEEQLKTSKQNRIMQRYDRGLQDSQEVGEEMQKENLTSIETKAEKGLLDDQPAPPGGGGGMEGEEGGAGGGETKLKTPGAKPPV